MGHPAHFARREDPSLCRRGHEAPRSSPFQQRATSARGVEFDGVGFEVHTRPREYHIGFVRRHREDA